MTAQTAPLLLLAEDDDELRELFVAALEQVGFHVVTVDDGFELLDYFDGIRGRSLPAPLVVVSDQRMPGRSGLDVAEQLDARGVRVPFYLVTAFPDDELRGRAERLGASVIAKPIDPKDLAQQLVEFV